MNIDRLAQMMLEIAFIQIIIGAASVRHKILGLSLSQEQDLESVKLLH